MSDVHVIELERRLMDLQYKVAYLEGEVVRLSQTLPKAFDAGGGGDGGTPPASYWAVGDGTAHVASGTWPSLTVATFTSDVYKLSGSTLVSVATGATINWPYKDAMSTTAGKLIRVTPNANGVDYDADLESCTAVT